MKLTINNDVIKVIPEFSVIAYDIDFENDYKCLVKSNKVTILLDDLKTKCIKNYKYDEITKNEILKETRDGYKKFGKDPSHTRPACESLLRRLVKGQDLYRLGDAIDLGNILSVETLRSVCVIDKNKLNGDIIIRLGNKEDIYEGINRGLINVTNIPVYTDNNGPFGCPTSDNERTMVDENTKGLIVMIIMFSNKRVSSGEQKLLQLYKEYTKIQNIKKLEVNFEKGV